MKNAGWKLFGVAALLLAVSPGRSAAEAALTIERGSVAFNQVVAVGRDLVVAGEVRATAAVLGGSARIDGPVAGDLIVLGGDAHLGSEARIEGDVFVLGGAVVLAPGARIAGRSVAYPTVGSAWVALLEGPSLGRSPLSPAVLGAKLALITAWLVLTATLFAVAGGGVLNTSRGVREQPFRNFFVGLTGVLAALMTALFFSAFAAAMVGVPLLALVVLAALLLKLWGMVAVFHATGQWLHARLVRKRWIPLNTALAGLVVLGVLKLLPWVGVWVWTAATLIGVGAALTTKFGRQEPWFAGGVSALER